MAVTNIFDLNINKQTTDGYYEFYVNQGDYQSRTIQANLYITYVKDGTRTAYNLTDETITISYEYTNGNGEIQNSEEFGCTKATSIGNNVITFLIPNIVVENSGKVKAQVKIYEDVSTLINTTSFLFYVGESISVGTIEDLQIPLLYVAPIVGSIPPSASTVGLLGQLYVDDNTSTLYYCTNITGSVYTWVAVSSGVASGGATGQALVKASSSDYDTEWATVLKPTDFEANTILAATLDNTPIVVTIEEQTVLGRVAGENISALTIDSVLSSEPASHNTLPSSKIVYEKLAEKANETLIDAGDYYTVKTPEGALQEVGSQLADVTEASRNLWTFGDQTFTRQKKIYPNYPAGTYYFSAHAESSHGFCTVNFYNSALNNLGSVQLTSGARTSGKLVLNDVVAQINLYSAEDYATSNGIEATFTDVQFESDEETEYVKPVTSIDSTARLSVSKLNDTASKATETTRNLWSGGDIEFTTTKDVEFSLPAGVYTFSAIVTSDDVATSICILYFRNAGGVICRVDLNRNTRSSYAFTLTEDATLIRFYAAGTINDSTGKTANYANIQIEQGGAATSYISHLSAVDHIAREGLSGVPVIVLENSDAIKVIESAKLNYSDVVASDFDTNIIIAHLTDIHGDVVRTRKFLDFCKYINVDIAICTGDIVSTYVDDGTYVVDEIVASEVPVLPVIGNHEVAKSSEARMTKSQVYDAFIEPLEILCGINTSGELYYYKDYPDKNVRVICLNNYDYEQADGVHETIHYSQAQLDFLVTALDGAITNEYMVIICSHEADDSVNFGQDNKFSQSTYRGDIGIANKNWMGSPICDIVAAYKAGGTINETYTISGIGDVTINHAFASAGTFVTYLCGHKHADLCGHLDNYPNQLIFTPIQSAILSHKSKEFIGNSDIGKVVGTPSENSFNVYIINPAQSKVVCVRVGANITYLCAKRDFEVFAY